MIIWRMGRGRKTSPVIFMADTPPCQLDDHQNGAGAGVSLAGSAAGYGTGSPFPPKPPWYHRIHTKG